MNDLTAKLSTGTSLPALSGGPCRRSIPAPRAPISTRSSNRVSTGSASRNITGKAPSSSTSTWSSSVPPSSATPFSASTTPYSPTASNANASSRKTSFDTTFFSDPSDSEADAIYGLDFALQSLVDLFRSAAEGYGTDKRILLLHGPVGSSKSTIARLLKKGAEHYSRT